MNGVIDDWHHQPDLRFGWANDTTLLASDYVVFAEC